jgi:hypothetical protein
MCSIIKAARWANKAELMLERSIERTISPKSDKIKSNELAEIRHREFCLVKN